MNELSRFPENYQFLPKTCVETDYGSIADFVFDLYVKTLERAVDEEEDDAFQMVPTKFMILKEGWYNFGELYFEFLKSGGDPEQWEVLQERMQEEEDEWEDFDIYNYLADVIGYNASYSMSYSEKGYEEMLSRDINLALKKFHFSYLKDDAGDSAYKYVRNIKIEEWVNPPWKQVW